MPRITLAHSDDYLEWRQGSGRTIEILDIQVCSDHRKRGHGRRMVDILIDKEMPKDTVLVYAITRTSNGIAQAFYQAMNFRVVALLWDFYRDEPSTTADAAMYGRNINRRKE